MKRISINIVLAATALGIIVASSCRQSPPEETETPSSVSVKVCRAEKTTLHPTLDLTGTIVAMPERSASISSQIAGRIQKVLVTEGQTVKADQALILLDPRSEQINVEKAQAAFDESQAILERLQHGYLPEEIAMARAETNHAKAQVQTLRGQNKAAKSLYDKHEMSDVQYAKLAAELQAAEATLDAAKAKLKLLEAGTRPEDIAKAKAQVAGAKADLKDAQLTLQFCTICTPITGRITQLTAQQGMAAAPAVILATVTDLSDVFARVRIPDVYQTRVPLQAEATVSVDMLPGKTFTGHFARTSGQADVATGAIDALIQVPNQDKLLQPGLTCRVHLSLDPLFDAIVIPANAVADRDGVPVITVVRDNKAYEIEVQLGERTGRLVQITKGLATGELVVTEGGYGLPDGCPVKVIQ